MSFTWKDTVATISTIVVIGFTIALTMGAFNNIESRWALATFAILVLSGATGLITGTGKMTRRAWSTVSLYILSLGALTITIVNAFFNSEAWLVAMMIAYLLIWIEFLGVDLFSHTSQDISQGKISTGGML